MNKGLSELERQLIDEAVRLGKVQKIPLGKSAFPGYIYCENEGRLKSSNQEQSEKFSSWAGPKARSAKAKRHRMQVLKMYNKGMTIKECSIEIGKSPNTVMQYLQILRREGFEVRDDNRITKDKAFKDRCDFFWCISKVFVGNVEDMTNMFGLGRNTLRVTQKKIGRVEEYEIIKERLAVNRAKAHRAGTKPTKEQQLEACARQMAADGYGYEDIAVKIGISKDRAKKITLEKSPPQK